jgi:hypothetical protein
MALFENGHALLIGAGGDLPESVTDVEGLATLLKDEARCAYPPAQVLTRADEEADRDGILAAFKALSTACQPESTCIVYFSGHGYRLSHPAVGSQYYLAPHGCDPGDLPGTAISGVEFADLLAGIPARRLLVLLDCCHAGGVGMAAPAKGGGLAFARAPLPGEALRLLGEGRGRALIASSKASEKSYGGKPLSAFTLALFEALCGIGNSQEDGYVRVADLALYAAKMVPRRTQDRQNPILHYEQADNFILAYYAAGEAKPKGLPFEVEPQVEPEPGAWRGWSVQVETGDIHVENISTGGAPYFGKFKGTYIEGNQINKSVNIHGQVSNSVIITGDDNQVKYQIKLGDFIEKLDEIQRLLPQSGLPLEQQEELQGDLADVENEAGKPQPDGSRIRRRLAGAVEFLANSTTVIAAAPQLIEMAKQLLQWARTLFPG